MRIFIITFGCKVNQYESQSILEKFCNAGCTKANSVEDADVIVVNSCTVTAESDKKVKKALHKIRKENNSAVIVLTGCMPQAFPKQMESINEADVILGNGSKNEILKYVLEFVNTKNKVIKIEKFTRKSKFESAPISDFNERTRAFLKIEDGCNRFCSYCIIPYARGRVRSKPLEDILLESKNLAQKGYKEVVLVGINLSAYGTDIGLNLCDAIEKVCAVDGIERVRLGSLEPEQMDENTIKRLSKQEKLCPQFHLSLQSGCDETLKRMNRHYTSEEYLKIVQNLRKYFKNASITTDVMVGFAGESAEEFKKSLNFVKKVEFSKVHVFAYSVRSGTRAAEFDNQVEPNEKKRRSQIMIEETDKSRRKFLISQVRKVEAVLYERRDKNGFFEGYTPNYTPVKVKVNEKINLYSKIIFTELVQAEDDYCFGKIADGINLEQP